MIKVFFITALVVTSRVPSEGWVQWSQTHNNRDACMDIIRKDHEMIGAAVKNYLGKDFKKIREMRCLTYKEAVELNTRLGH